MTVELGPIHPNYALQTCNSIGHTHIDSLNGLHFSCLANVDLIQLFELKLSLMDGDCLVVLTTPQDCTTLQWDHLA